MEIFLQKKLSIELCQKHINQKQKNIKRPTGFSFGKKPALERRYSKIAGEKEERN